MKNLFSNSHAHLILAVVAAVLFLTFSIGSALTHRPQVDEGLFASPAFNLATEGYFGTTILETENTSLTRIEQRTYWVMPLFLLNVSASFEVLGFSLFSMRLVSIFWGLALLFSWYFIALKLSQNRNIALLCLILLACDYTVLDTASSGRMDMMSASLGFAAMAAYLLLRERNLLLAVLLSQTFVVASGLTHPNGIMAFLGVLFLTIFLDFRRFEWKYLLVGALPYLIGGSIFGLWVLQDPAAFKNQFIDNAVMSGRMSGFDSPFDGIIREFTKRYPHAFGLGLNSGGHSGPVYLKGLILIGYAVGILGVIFFKELRRNRNYFVLLVITLIYFLTMSVIDGQKQTPYLIHIVPFYCAFLAILINHLREKRLIPLPLLILGISGFLALQAGGMALRIKQNTYGKVYQPTVNFLKQNAAENDMIMGGAEMVFGLEFSKNFISDGQFGYKTGKRPKFIVYDDAVHSSWQESKKFNPEFHEYFPHLLSEEYEIVYENPAYKIYARR